MDKRIITKSVQFFTESDRHEIIEEYLRGGITKEEIWRKYTGKSDHGRLLKWMRDYGYVDDVTMRSKKTTFANMARNKQPQTGNDFETLQLNPSCSSGLQNFIIFEETAVIFREFRLF